MAIVVGAAVSSCTSGDECGEVVASLRTADSAAVDDRASSAPASEWSQHFDCIVSALDAGDVTVWQVSRRIGGAGPATLNAIAVAAVSRSSERGGQLALLCGTRGMASREITDTTRLDPRVIEAFVLGCSNESIVSGEGDDPPDGPRTFAGLAQLMLALHVRREILPSVLMEYVDRAGPGDSIAAHAFCGAIGAWTQQVRDDLVWDGDRLQFDVRSD